MESPRAGHELLEHTADLGVRASGATLEELFEQATMALAEVLGAWRPGPGEVLPMAVEAPDPGGLLVDWLNEVVYVQEVRGASLAAVEVERVGGGRAGGSLTLTPQPPSGGIYVKAVTYHQLKVERRAGGWLAEVYLDV
ncbi:MAG TPA: archease [Actinomycetes bacterium]|jgi:SHS2 domain-containing protein|nr:archease [Actinomycetes bacterium]